MRTTVVLVSLLVCVGLFGCAGDGERSAIALEREVQRVSEAGQFWPGYDPIAVPLAIYDGTTTFLFRHRAPPEGFVVFLPLPEMAAAAAPYVAAIDYRPAIPKLRQLAPMPVRVGREAKALLEQLPLDELDLDEEVQDPPT